jgi:hypothetical protein
MYHCIMHRTGSACQEILSISHRPGTPGHGAQRQRVSRPFGRSNGRGGRPAPGRTGIASSGTGTGPARAPPRGSVGVALDLPSAVGPDSRCRRSVGYMVGYPYRVIPLATGFSNLVACYCLSLTELKTSLIRTLSEHVVRRMAIPIVVDSTPDQQAATVELEARGREKCADSGDVSNGHVCSKHRW